MAGEETAAPGSRIYCALAGERAFTRDCAVEQVGGSGGRSLIVRHPEGGFRRFEVQGGSLVAADGAQEAQIARVGDTLEITVGTDRYRIPPGLAADAAP